ncbi:MAG: tetratricopeptide repeat protein [Caldithrix sp.]|nr:MAG: tetratricopeptide repeat protein [Caldithrix sp.]
MKLFLKFILPAVGVLFLLGLLIFLRSSKNHNDNISTSKSRTAYVFLNLDPKVEYVGDEDCADCHSEIYQTFKQTGMGRSFYPPTTENIIEDYTKHNHVYDRKSNLHYEVYEKDGHFFQSEYRLDEKKRTHELVRKIDYIVGSGNHNRTYLRNDNGFLYEMPVTWYSEKNVWDLSPGYHTRNLRFSRPIVQECMNCHNSYAGHVEHSENLYSDVPSGIGCERCHGPGQLHVERRQNSTFAELKNMQFDSTIVNPKHLSPDLQMDVCRQCHLQGDIRVIKKGKKESDFRPGFRLTDIKSVYIRDKVPSGDFRIASHGARLSLSTCFLKSGGNMVCTTCHNPHKPVQTLSRSFFNERCLICHNLETLSQANSQANHRSTGDCVSCHMRQGATSDILHVNFTDHWIRKEIKELSKTESDLLQSQDGAAVTFKDFYEEQDSAAGLRLGIAYVKYFESKHGLKEYLQRAIPLMTSGLQSHPDHQNGLYFLGKAYAHLGRLNEASIVFQNLIQLAPQHALGHFQLGSISQKLHQSAQAIAAYQTSLAIFPYNATALNNLGNIYSESPDPQKAIEFYERALQVQSDFTLAYNNLGDLYAYKLNDFETGSKYFKMALQQDPDFVTALHNLGNISLGTGNENEALKYFEAAVKVDSQFVPAYGNLAVIHLRRGEKKKAIGYLRKVLSIDSEDLRAQDMLRQIENSN